MRNDARTLTIGVTFALFLVSVVRAHLGTQVEIKWHSDIGLTGLASIPGRLAANELDDPQATLKLELGSPPELHQREVANCAQYLAAVEVGYAPATTYDSSLEFPFIRDCYVLRDLRAAGVPVKSYLPSWSYGVLAFLPPILEWGEKQDDVIASEPKALTWTAANPAVHGTALTSDTLNAEDDSSDYHLQVVGIGDFNKDGTADMAIVADVSAKEGTYARRDYMIVTTCAGAKRFIRLSAAEKPFKLTNIRCR